MCKRLGPVRVRCSKYPLLMSFRPRVHSILAAMRGCACAREGRILFLFPRSEERRVRDWVWSERSLWSKTATTTIARTKSKQTKEQQRQQQQNKKANKKVCEGWGGGGRGGGVAVWLWRVVYGSWGLTVNRLRLVGFCLTLTPSLPQPVNFQAEKCTHTYKQYIFRSYVKQVIIMDT